MMKLRKNQKGFTLIEVLLIVVILGIIAAIAIPRLMASKQEAQEKSCRTNVANINTAIEKYYFDKGVYPDYATVSTARGPFEAPATQGELYFPDGPPICPSGGTYDIGVENRAVCKASATFAGHGDINGAGAGTYTAP